LRAMTLDIPVRPHGHCEYCEGGTGYEAVQTAAVALQSGEAERIAAIPVSSDSPAAGCGTGGCGSCSAT
jgi:hypothetical protein